MKKEKVKVPKEVMDLVREREEARKNKDWGKSDDLRSLSARGGYLIEDTPEGPIIKKK